MRIYSLLIFTLLLCNFASAQSFAALWEGYFSYNSIVDLAEGDGKIYVASENAVFIYDKASQDLKTLTTVDGLSGQNITSMVYSTSFDLLLLGYENGLMEIVFQDGESILSVVDILDKTTIMPTAKRINHFNEHDGLVYISTDYGVSVYDLQALEFGDTYFIGTGGSQIAVKQTTVFGTSIYAACYNNNALKRAAISSANLIDYQQWQTLDFGDFSAVQAVGSQLYAVKSNKSLYRVNGNTLSTLITYNDMPLDVKSIAGQLIVTTQNHAYVYDQDFNAVFTFATNTDIDTDFNTGLFIESQLYIGTSSKGVLLVDTNTPSDFDFIKPEGPTRNNAFKIESGSNDLWVSYGDYTLSYNPSPVRSYGVSHYSEESWRNIPYDSLLGAKNLNAIAINPLNPNQVFISAFENGLLEINNEEATKLFDQTNSPLQSLVLPGSPNYISIRQSGTVFDRNGLLWTLTSRVDRALKSYNPSSQQWTTHSFQNVISDPLNDELGFGDLAVGRDGTKWIASYKNGVIAYNETGNRIRRISSPDENMPSTTVNAVAIDDRNQLWIGTIQGVRVLYNTSNFFSDPNPRVNQIVVLDDGIPQELLSGQYITDIKVDGSNNKWIGTYDSGVFCFTPDGQNTIYHFTTTNSPLPSNIINDISIDASSGKVYFATNRGLVSFSSGGSSVSDDLKDAFVYPNPVRPEYDILGANDLNDINKGVKIKGVTNSVNIKITDIEGNLVAEAQSKVNARASRQNYNFAIDGGTAIWNGKNLNNRVVASGVYLIMITDLESFETKVLKLLIIR